MSKHTPGPWFITGRMTKYIEARIDGGMLQEVAACGPTEADCGYGDQQRANAMLIAAAPDLLEALESSNLNLHTGTMFIDGECKCSQCEFVRKARAAIAKAKGESQ